MAVSRDIPQAASHQDRDNFTVVAARSVPVTVTTRSQPLLTPPNSVSPAFPPSHGLQAQLQKSRPDALDTGSVPARAESLSPISDSSGPLTSAMLAHHHLPSILLDHGPLAIRHIIGYLTTSVPGFSGLPPAKARKLVVAALEGETSHGVRGEVQFEKIGWGRWAARRFSQSKMGGDNLGTSYGGAVGSIPIACPLGDHVARKRYNQSTSSNDEPFSFSHDDCDVDMMEYEADKMSLDDPASASCSEAPDDNDQVIDGGSDDATDDEDWGAVGAAALRAGSYQTMEAARSDSYNRLFDLHTVPQNLRSSSITPGFARPPAVNAPYNSRPNQPPNGGNTATYRNNNFLSPLSTLATDPQEREAVEALLRLGSV